MASPAAFLVMLNRLGSSSDGQDQPVTYIGDSCTERTGCQQLISLGNVSFNYIDHNMLCVCLFATCSSHVASLLILCG